MKKNNITKQTMPYLILILVIFGTLVFYNIGNTKINIIINACINFSLNELFAVYVLLFLKRYYQLYAVNTLYGYY